MMAGGCGDFYIMLKGSKWGLNTVETIRNIFIWVFQPWQQTGSVPEPVLSLALSTKIIIKKKSVIL